MATPAASPIQKRYTAGSCTLDVVLQLSALSQWYPQPIVQDLQFKLWVQPAEQPADRIRGIATLPRLIAKGDRAAFQEISQYLSQKVHSELAIAHLSKSAPPPPEPPPFLNLAQPLSYLQLCDLTIVMRQCEQASRMLPVAIASAPKALPEAIPEASLDSVPQAASDLSDRQSRNVIPFAAVRRHPIWASSAAAALLAVGLTAVVWQNDQNSSSLTTATAPAELESSQPNADLAPDTVLPGDTAEQDTVELPERTVPAQTEKPEQGNEQTATPAPAPPQVVAATPNVEAIQPPAQSPITVQREPAPSPEAADVAPEVVPESPAEPLPAQTEALAKLPEVAAPSPQPEEMEDDTSARELDSAFSRTNQRVPSRAAARQASPMPDTSSPSGLSDAPDEGAIRLSLSPTDQMIAQAQPYFQRQWNSADVALEAVLIYTMQVSELGGVVGFEAEGEIAEGYRDRLQPEGLAIDMTQENLAAIANLTFRIEITPNGQVQIIPAP